MNSYTIIKADGTEEVKAGVPTLKDMQEVVGGYIELFPANHPDFLIVLNEEGKLKDLPFNKRANTLCQDNLMEGDYIVGDVIYIRGELLQ